MINVGMSETIIWSITKNTSKYSLLCRFSVRLHDWVTGLQELKNIVNWMSQAYWFSRNVIPFTDGIPLLLPTVNWFTGNRESILSSFRNIYRRHWVCQSFSLLFEMVMIVFSRCFIEKLGGRLQNKWEIFEKQSNSPKCKCPVSSKITLFRDWCFFVNAYANAQDATQLSKHHLVLSLNNDKLFVKYIPCIYLLPKRT